MNTGWSPSRRGYRRRTTREVRVGDVLIGGRNPIRVQSMTTPATSDVAATVAQVARLVDAGCEIVRVTVPTSNDARALPEIRKAMAARGIRAPLVADIHFSPGAALKAVEHVEKIRVNPGNYADRKQFAVREYTDQEYESELARLADTFRPLVLRAKELGVAMRIGTNHGSLSDRILNRYGDTPLGMAESALEFVRVCEAEGYREIVLSMKSSNPVVTIEAYRLLADLMAREGMDYPFHLGVTEAGDGEDGRIKSAIGIGALLDDGIGDTIRVSLTEDPVEEIPVALRLVEPYNRMIAASPDIARPQGASALATSASSAPDATSPAESAAPLPFDLYSYRRRRSRVVRIGPREIGGESPVAVLVRLLSRLDDPAAIRAEIDAHAGPRVPLETRADIVEAAVASREDLERLAVLRGTLRLVAPQVALIGRLTAPVAADLLASHDRPSAPNLPHPSGAPGGRGTSLSASDATRDAGAADGFIVPLATLRQTVTWEEARERFGAPVVLEGSAEELLDALRPDEDAGGHRMRREPRLEEGPAAGSSAPLAVMLAPAHGPELVREVRRLVAGLARLGLDVPVVLAYSSGEVPEEDLLLGASLALGSLLCDGIGDAIVVGANDSLRARGLSFNILQGARVRISKTEFISCPSCGRTLFDLEETTRRIKERTSHLKGLKIAVMGCVVNGPGEMADADFGYVGWGTEKIALFVGKEMVARDIPVSEADDKLVELIKTHGKWQDPAPAPAEPAR